LSERKELRHREKETRKKKTGERGGKEGREHKRVKGRRRAILRGKKPPSGTSEGRKKSKKRD